MKGLGLHHVRLKLEKINRDVREVMAMVSQLSMEGLGEAPPEKNIVATFCEEWKARYGSNPTIGGKEAGTLNRMVKEHGLKRAEALIKAFLKMNDSFYIRKRHDPLTLSRDIQAVGHFADHGKNITATEAKQMERTSEYKDLMSRVDSGDL